MGKLTTHVLDTANGCPAAGLRIDLFSLEDGRQRIAGGVTNDDGRIDPPLLSGPAFRPGLYELEFHAGAYHARIEEHRPAGRFLEVVPVRFRIVGTRHYHVPLLLSPYGYSTYRGS
ncbi:MAG: hydroxyisourate hydrolase [Paracoccaceae bacterium]|nr:hydroxyisourate hydrolase [Paracoccaceae bacterium]MDE2911427.1 hydroxyisourate hydrolase [Paracoccaceae bacterium]